MMGGFIEPILQDPAIALNQRLLDGDVTASAEIAEIYFPDVRKYLLTLYSSHYPEDLIEAAVTDAFVSYLQNPTQYNNQETSLGRFLVMSSHRDLIDLARNENRHGVHGLPKGSQFVELEASIDEHEIENQASLSVEEQVSFLSAPVWSKLDMLLPDTQDRNMVFLMMEGVRETSDYAAIINITEMSLEDQEDEVKRQKDRIKKVLQRHLSRTDLEI
jgi:hypothetical protein